MFFLVGLNESCGAALKHYQETGKKYPLAVKLGTITTKGIFSILKLSFFKVVLAFQFS